MSLRYKLTFLAIVCIAYALRIHGINWDHGFNLHPDERAIVMFTTDLSVPEELSELLSPDSSLNPKFFAYGNFPLYVLKIMGSSSSWFNHALGTYDHIALVGRMISVIADIGTLLIIFLISKKLFTRRIGLFAASLYAVSVFPIQASHFYAVDILLTFFCILTVYFILCLAQNETRKNAILTGVSLGLALATKISALVLVIPLIVFIVFAISHVHSAHKEKRNLHQFKKLLLSVLLIFFTALGTFIITQPYVLIDWKTFIDQTQEQSGMTHDVFTFPYTMQYYGKIPYIYELKNVFFWGLGPVIASLSAIGTILFVKNSHKSRKLFQASLIVGSFILVYFIIVGSFAVGWMRYMLPLYPFFALFGGITIHEILKKSRRHAPLYVTVCLVLGVGITIWPISFTQIYGKTHPRVEATNWILDTIPPSSTIATEHWDDRLPLTGGEIYSFVELPMYDTESTEKWTLIEDKLKFVDYIILSSNRLYTPLQKLTDCTVLPEGRCYTRSAKFYNDLFSGNTAFEKVAEFTNFPTVPLLNISINDQSADESFTVYDHPKVMIFKKTQN